MTSNEVQRHRLADPSYADLVTGRLGIVPKINEASDNIGAQHFSATASVLVKPVDGVKVSAGYVYYPDNYAERYLSYDHGDDKHPDDYADHAWAAAVDWDIAGTFDLDFDIGVSASYVGAYREDAEDEVGTVIAATILHSFYHMRCHTNFGFVQTGSLNTGAFPLLRQDFSNRLSASQ